MVETDDPSPPDGELVPDESNSPTITLEVKLVLSAEPCISFHAVIGQLVPSTLRFAGTINSHDVVILI